MSLQTLIQESYETLLQYVEGFKVILLHPQSHYRSMVVARLLAEAPRPVFYYSMGPYDVNIVSFLSGFTHDLADQHPTFGRYVNQLGIESRQHEPEILHQKLQQDLAELADEPYFLVIDEYDASESANDVQEFMEKLLLNLPDGCQVVINSRTLPRLPWYALVARHDAVILKDNEMVKADIYQTRREGDIAHLDVQGLGPGKIACNGESVDEWEGHLPRLLLLFALERPVVTRAEICQAFWPKLDSDQAVNVFHVTKRRLHKALGFDALIHENGYYQVNPDVGFNYDVNNFVNALLRGRMSTGKAALEAWQEAIDLYKGPFLQGHNEEWVLFQREAYQAGYLEAMMAIANNRLEEGKPEHALRILVQATSNHDGFEALHREIMKIYAHLGRRSEAASHYQNLAQRLEGKGEKPETATQILYKELIS